MFTTVGILEYGGLSKRAITIDYTKCGTADSTNFPVLVSFTNASLKTKANGGKVENSNGYDIQFFSDIGLTSKLSWEVEKYDATTGEIRAWVKIPTISYTANTVFYIAYGDSSISTFQGGIKGSAWDSNFKIVYHCNETTGTTIADSTNNANDGVKSSSTTPASTTGYIGNGQAYASSGQINIGTPILLNDGTIQAWINSNSYAGALCAGANFGEGYWGYNIASNGYYVNWGGFYVGFNAPSLGIWNLVTMTRAGSTYYVYINGNTPQVAVGYSGSALVRQFGNLYSGGGFGYLNASVDEIRISNIARSASWIKTNYNNQSSPNTFYTVGAEL